jgi:hypothetical protein
MSPVTLYHIFENAGLEKYSIVWLVTGKAL